MAYYPPLFLCMLAMLLTWGAVAFVVVGWGLLAQRALGSRAASLDDLMRAFWFGAVGWIVYLQILHCLLPVGFLSLSLGAAIGISGWLLSGRRPIIFLVTTIRRHPVAAAFGLLVVVLLSGNAIGPSAIYDTGLYHLQAVRWNQAFPVVPGLGNLHSRLAFNNSCFLLQAQALLGPWRSTGFGIVNGLLALAVTAQASLSLVRIAKRQSDSYLADAIGSLLLLPVIVMATRSLAVSTFFISSMSPDVTVSLFHFAALGYAAHLLARPPGAATAQRTVELLVLTTSLLTASVCIKTSNAPFAFVLFLALLAAVTIEWARSGRRWWRPVLITVGVSSLLFVPWAARGVILSGYPVFPIELLSVDVPWRLPASATQAMRDILLLWSRGGQPHSPGDPWVQSWLLHWIRSDVALFSLPVGLAVVAAAMALLRLRAGSASVRERRAMAVLLLATSAALLTWWVTAPDPRYGFQLFYSLAICVAAWAICVPLGANSAIVMRRLALTLAVPVVVVLAFRVHFAWHRREMPLLDALVAVTLPIPMSPRGHTILPEAPLRRFTTGSGLIIHVPVDNDQAWDAPLPSAPAPVALGLDLRYLRLRRAADLSAGFWMAPPPESVDP